MTLEEKRAALVAELSAIPGGTARLARVVELGRGRALPEELKNDAHRVEGCLSKLWFVATMRDGCCHFEADSDSAVVKGIASLLCRFFSGHTPAEILAAEPGFLAELGISQHLTPNRRNGLARLWERIRAFARDHGPVTPAAK